MWCMQFAIEITLTEVHGATKLLNSIIIIMYVINIMVRIHSQN